MQPTKNKYDPYDRNQYVYEAPSDSTTYESASQPYNESTYQQQHINVTNNWALSHCDDLHATVVNRQHEIRNIHNNARHIREIELHGTCVTTDDVLIFLPEYKLAQPPGQNNNKNLFLGFNS